MKYIILFFVMFWLHLIDDFHLQGLLGNLKQKSWWEKNYPNKLYKDDWEFAYTVVDNFIIFLLRKWIFVCFVGICVVYSI